jgi:hypothetical protein
MISFSIVMFALPALIIIAAFWLAKRDADSDG